jgi:Lon protease-like protein
MARLLPLFPLQLVVFPGSAVPLHIFEERYKEMVGEAEAAGAEFGIVLAKDGGIVNTGCTVLVETVLKRYPDGRFDVLTRGQRRFLVKALDQDKDYLRGEVEYYGDDEPESPPADLRQRAVEAFDQMLDALAPLWEAESERRPDPSHPFLSFELAAGVDDLDFRNLLQRSRSETDRLRAFIDFAGDYADRKQYAAKMRRTAPQNGFGHKPAIN